MILLLQHLLNITGGAFAGAISVLFLHMLGLAATPARYVEHLRGSPNSAVIGAAIVVLWCWYGIKFDIPLAFLLHTLLGFALIFGLSRRTHIARNIVQPEFNRQGLKFLAAFYIFYALAYCFLMPSVSGDFLPIVRTSNNDILNYLNYTSYLQRLGPSNIAGYSFVPGAYESTPAVFYVMGAISLFFNGDAMWSAMPTLFGTVALIGCVVVRLSRSMFAVSGLIAICIGAVLISGPFFRYITGNYFLSQLLGTLVVLLLISNTAELLQKRAAPRLGILVFLITPYHLLIFYFYPPLSVVSIGLQLGLVCVFYLLFPTIPKDSRQGYAEARRLIIRWGAAIFSCLAIVALVDPGQFREAAERVVSLSTLGAGWSMDLISPASIAGFPGSLEVHGATSQAVSIATCTSLMVVISYFYLFQGRGDRAPLGKSLLVLAVLTYVAYFAYFLLRGLSYQQWKLASFLPMTFSWVLWSAAVAVASPALFASRRSVTSTRIWRDMLVVLISSLLIVGNLVLHVRNEPPLQRFSANYGNLRALDMMGAWQDINFQMSGFSSTFFPVYFISHKTLHFMSPSYYPMEELWPEEISSHNPLFVEGSNCEAADVRAVTVTGLGCLYFHPPYLTMGSQYKIGQIPTLASKGLSSLEPAGRWSDGAKVELSFQVDSAELSRNSEGFINLNIGPFLHTGIDGQRIVVTWGNGRVARESIRDSGWISLPYNRKDWGGVEARRMSIRFDLADAIAPHDVDSRSGDMRKVAINFSLVSVSTAPLGRVITEPR